METESKKFTKKQENFKCEMCSTEIKGSGYTDHCTNCLWSKHVDVNPGDRSSDCKGMMKPIKVWHDRSSFLIEYKCVKCGMKKKVKAAESDNKELLFNLSGTS